MRSLGSHIECLRELRRDERAATRPLAIPSVVGFVAGGLVTALALAGSLLLEELVLERLGLR